MSISQTRMTCVGSPIHALTLHELCLLFGFSAGGMFVAIYGGLPWLHQRGFPEVLSASITLVGPQVLLFVASFVACWRDGHLHSWTSLRQRFRLAPLHTADWCWAVGLGVFLTLSAAVLQPITRWLAEWAVLTPPAFLPTVLDPRIVTPPSLTVFMGIPLKGQWWVLGGYVTAVVMNVMGEEFYWRGYIFPRQEQNHATWTWLVHGLLWNAFHLFWPWALLGLLPGCLAMAYVAQKRRNTWICIMAHFAFNLTGVMPVLRGILGR